MPEGSTHRDGSRNIRMLKEESPLVSDGRLSSLDAESVTSKDSQGIRPMSARRPRPSNMEEGLVRFSIHDTTPSSGNERSTISVKVRDPQRFARKVLQTLSNKMNPSSVVTVDCGNCPNPNANIIGSNPYNPTTATDFAAGSGLTYRRGDNDAFNHQQNLAVYPVGITPDQMYLPAAGSRGPLAGIAGTYNGISAGLAPTVNAGLHGTSGTYFDKGDSGSRQYTGAASYALSGSNNGPIYNPTGASVNLSYNNGAYPVSSGYIDGKNNQVQGSTGRPSYSVKPSGSNFAGSDLSRNVSGHVTNGIGPSVPDFSSYHHFTQNPPNQHVSNQIGVNQNNLNQNGLNQNSLNQNSLNQNGLNQNPGFYSSRQEHNKTSMGASIGSQTHRPNVGSIGESPVSTYPVSTYPVSTYPVSTYPVSVHHNNDYYNNGMKGSRPTHSYPYSGPGGSYSNIGSIGNRSNTLNRDGPNGQTYENVLSEDQHVKYIEGEITVGEEGNIIDQYHEADGTKVVVVEVPIHQEVVKQVTKHQVVEQIREVQVDEIQYVDRIVEIPEIQWVDKVVEVPQDQVVYTEVKKTITVDVPKEVIKYVPQVEKRIIEQIQEVPGPIEHVEVPGQTIEQPVEVLFLEDEEVPTVVSQLVSTEVKFDSTMAPLTLTLNTYDPDVIPVEILLPVPVSIVQYAQMDHSLEHYVKAIDHAHWNSLVRFVNVHLVEQFGFQALPIVTSIGTNQIPLLPTNSPLFLVEPISSEWVRTHDRATLGVDLKPGYQISQGQINQPARNHGSYESKSRM